MADDTSTFVIIFALVVIYFACINNNDKKTEVRHENHAPVVNTDTQGKENTPRSGNDKNSVPSSREAQDRKSTEKSDGHAGISPQMPAAGLDEKNAYKVDITDDQVDEIQIKTLDDPVNEPLQPNIEKCGISLQHTESKADYPWMAVIHVESNDVKNSDKGIGVLISPKFVLTALSWLEEGSLQSPDLFDVELGHYDLSKYDSALARTYKVRQVHPHPHFQDTTIFQNDLVLLELTTNVHEAFKPICLPASLPFDDGDQATVIGWGHDFEDRYKYILQETKVQKVNQKSCAESYAKEAIITSKMICARTVGRELCQADSGTPLMSKYNGRYYLQGLATFGDSHSNSVGDYPNVYTSVSGYLDWISLITKLKV